MSSLPPGFARLIAALMALHASMAVARITGLLWLLHGGHSEIWAGALLGLIALTPALLGAPAGAWADRYGLWRPLLGGALCGVLGVSAALVWPSVPTLAAAALGTGAAIGLAAVAVQREIALIAQAPGQAVPAQALYSWAAMGPALSNTASPVLAGLLIDGLGYRAGFGLALLMPLLALWLLRARRHAPGTGLAHTPSLLPAFDLLRSKALRLLLVLNMVFAVSWDAHGMAVPLLGHARAYSASTIGLLLGCFAVAVFAVRVLIVRYGGRFSDRQTLQGALALAGGVMAAYAWLPGMLGMAVGSFLMGLALGAVQPTMLAALTRATPAERHGQALGLRMLVTNSAGVLMPLLFGALAAAAGPTAPLLLMALLAAACWPAAKQV